MSPVACPSGFEEAERCVQCALCLPHCPTYRLTHDESESPRGRLAMLAAWGGDSAALDPSMRAALDHCLGCLACEVVCPAAVPYGRLIDRYHEVTERPLRTPLVRLLVWLTRRHRVAGALHHLLQGLQETGILSFLRRIAPGGLARVLSLMPDPYPRAGTNLRRMGARNAGTRRVSILMGCVSSLWMPEAYAAAETLLVRWGYAVDLAPHAFCCGALARHAGRVRTAEALRAELRDVLSADQPVLVLDSGCVGETRAALGSDRPGARPVHELAAFLDANWPEAFKATLDRPERVGLHIPCTQRTEVGDAGAPARLLRRIGNLTVQAIPDGYGCCGAAGSYVLREPGMSGALAAPLVGSLGPEPPDRIVTTNIGCRLRWQAELRQAGLEIPVEHPVDILLRACGHPRPATG